MIENIPIDWLIWMVGTGAIGIIQPRLAMLSLFLVGFTGLYAALVHS